MKAIHRKLIRDLWHIRGQVVAISLVIAAAVSVYVMYLGAFESLRLTQAAYYSRYRFGDVFGSLKRGPLSLEKRIREIPGVAQVALRVSASVTLDIEGMSEPATGRLISIPPQQQPILNDIFIRRGRYIDPERANEVLVNEGFALAHNLQPGDTLSALINGRRRRLEIAGIALSPEYVYTIRPTDIMPDDRRFGILWMNRDELAAAFNMSGGFNDVSLGLTPGASEKNVIAELDRLLDRYGGLGATPRSLQISHWYLNNELNQLQSFGLIIPLIFMGVAAFLLNIVLGRIITVQREQIAALKALGYTNFEVGLHYYLWGIVVAMIGTALGLGAGMWLASSLVRIYNDFFRFPVLEFQVAPRILATAALVSIATALLGTHGAVRRAVRLPPAEAMRPQSPTRYRVSLIERIGLGAWLSPISRIIARNISRRPMRSALSTIGIAFGAAMVIVGMFSLDAINYAMDIQFNVAQRQDLTVTFTDPVSARAFHEMANVDGVMAAEPLRSVPVRLRFGPRSRQTAIAGVVDGAGLNRVIDSKLRPVAIPPDGIVLSRKMAEILGATAGDRLEVDVLEGARPRRDVVVAAVAEEFLGASVYMDIDSLHRLMREDRTLSGAYLQVDESRLDRIYSRLKAIPAVAGVALKKAAIQSFKKTIEQNMAVMIFFNEVFSNILAFGVIYNAVRISLSERSWELASLRVIGFTRREISRILLGEFAVLVAIAIPLGLAIGYMLSAIVIVLVGDTELYRIPLVVGRATFGAGAATVLAAAVVSGFVVRHRLNRLDLVAVLKTRE